MFKGAIISFQKLKGETAAIDNSPLAQSRLLLPLVLNQTELNCEEKFGHN